MKYTNNILGIFGLIAILATSSAIRAQTKKKEHEVKVANLDGERVFETARANELTQIGGKCYFLSTFSRSNDDANTFCLNNNLTLASLVTKEDNDNVNAYLNAVGYHTNAVNHIWTSGHRFTCKKDMWYWNAINTPVTYTQWKKGEPNDSGNENCIELLHPENELLWNDYSCTKEQRFLCEGPCRSA